MSTAARRRRAPGIDAAPPGVPDPAPDEHDGAEIVDLRERRAAIRRGADPAERRAPADAPPAIIHRPDPPANRSAPGIHRAWVLEFEPMRPKPLDPLMGWTGAEDPQRQVRLTFPSLEEARRFAEARGWRYLVRGPRRRRPVIKSYADRFAPDRRVA